jgi:type II secretory pathway pseudopilin PulG
VGSRRVEEVSMRAGRARWFGEDPTGFTMVDLAVGLAIMGLLIGAILGSIQMVRSAKIKRQAEDLAGLAAVVQEYLDRFSRLPGDANSDGYLDADSEVWIDLEREGLARSSRRSPFGAPYFFGADTTSQPLPHRNGNYIRISLPPYVAERIDHQLDDGVNYTGRVTSDSDYGGTARIDLYYFMD